jgi:hypothetical protein
MALTRNGGGAVVAQSYRAALIESEPYGTAALLMQMEFDCRIHP